MVRLLKAILVVFVALQALFYALNNIANFDAALAYVSAVLTMADHTLYPNHFGPAVTAPALIQLALWFIIVCEMLVGLLGFKGAFDMFMARGASADRFNASKTFGLASCGLAMIVWFGLFMAFAGAYFQMWQTGQGAGALNGAFMYAISSAVVLIFVNQPD